MKLPTIASEPKQPSYDVVIIGGAMIGSSVAWFLSDNTDFDGTILVVEMDPTYQWATTSHTNSCIRQQFSNETNVRISQYGVQFIRNFRENLGGDPDYILLRGIDNACRPLRSRRVRSSRQQWFPPGR